MTSHVGYGSKTYAISADGTDEVAGAGERCVIDKILVGGASTSTDCDISLQRQDGTVIHSWLAMDLTDADALRHGLSCGPWGLESLDGLQVVTLDNASLVIALTVCFRRGIL